MKEWISPIPKTIHLIWIGTNPIPDYTHLFIDSFFKNCPQFQIKLWTEKELTKKNFPKTFKYIQKAKSFQGKPMVKDYSNTNTIHYYGKDNNIKNYSKYTQMTDLMRLEIIYNEGGYYFDTTFEILKPLYNILNREEKFVGCNEIPRFKDFHYLSNSFFGATKNNIILKRLLSKPFLDNINFSNPAVDNETGPSYLRNGIYNSDNIHIYPTNYFYPFVEEYAPNVNPAYRKASENECFSKNKKKTYKKIQKGYIKYPCNKYNKSYALKHWQLGGSWYYWT